MYRGKLNETRDRSIFNLRMQFSLFLPIMLKNQKLLLEIPIICKVNALIVLLQYIYPTNKILCIDHFIRVC